MERFKPTKIVLSQINGGNEYNNGDGVGANAINNAIEASAWAQALGTNQPNTENVDKVGTPTVSIETMSDGTPRLKFENLKGEQGEKGLDGNIDEETLSQITQNTAKINVLENVLIQSGTIDKQDSAMTEEIRQTGGTLLEAFTIVDDSLCTVKEISGNTVKCSNVLNMEEAVNGTTCIKNADGSYTFSASGGADTPMGNEISSTEGYVFNINDTWELTAKVIANPNNLTMIGVWGWIYSLVEIVNGEIKSTVSNIDGWTLGKIQFHSAMNQNIEGLVLSEISIHKVENGVTPEYQPYFTGLKNAKISGIKSVGRNLVDLDAMLNDVLVKNNDGTYTISKLSSGRFSKQFNTYLPAGTYRLSWQTVDYKMQNWVDASTTNNLSPYIRFLSGNKHVNERCLYVERWREQTVTLNEPVDKIDMYCRSDNTNGDYFIYKNIMINKGSIALPYMPYTESTMQLPQTVELGKWDYIENGQLVRETIVEAYDGTKYDETNGTYNGTDDFILSQDGTQVAYKGTATSTPIDFDNEYLVWDKGEEQVLTPEDENGFTSFDYGANTTEENEYMILLGGAK
jgi:hypothetical protein